MGSVECLEGIESRLEDLNENDYSVFEQNRQKLDDIANMLSNYRNVMAGPSQDTEAFVSGDSDSMDETAAEMSDEQELQPYAGITDGKTPRSVKLRRKADSYQVVRGDNLWDISAKEKITNDPFQWLKIYSANRDQIIDPDVIEM